MQTLAVNESMDASNEWISRCKQWTEELMNEYMQTLNGKVNESMIDQLMQTLNGRTNESMIDWVNADLHWILHFCLINSGSLECPGGQDCPGHLKS